MAKFSRELALLRLLLQDRLVAPPQEANLKLVEFEQKDGDRIAVNPNHVASVEERSATLCRVVMQDGSDLTVTGAFSDILDSLVE